MPPAVTDRVMPDRTQLAATPILSHVQVEMLCVMAAQLIQVRKSTKFT